MTDNELKKRNKDAEDRIIKAFECLSGSIVCCQECGYNPWERCKEQVAKDALDFINRQKAEIERLRKMAIVPPCDIDDPLYFLGKYTGQIVMAYVTGIQKTEHDMFLFTDSGCFVSVNQQLGKSVFLTEEEAQKALEKESKQ